MSSRFRPTEPRDGPAISHLMQQVFSMPPEHPGLQPSQMDWKYWRKHPGWEGSRGYVMERDGQIVAHGSVTPLTGLWGERRLKMVDLIDWAAQPANPGAGITLLKRVSQLVDGSFIAGGTDAAQKVFASLGFRESVPATRFALPLRPLERFIRDAEPLWKRAARLARNTAWRMDGLALPAAAWSARPLSAAEILHTKFPTPHPGAQAAVFERTPEDIAFLLDCPATPARFYLVEQNGAACGYFVLNFAINQCRIGEAWVEPGGSSQWQSLYRLAVREAISDPHITEIVTVATSDAAAQRALRESGFRPRGVTPLQVQMRDGDYPEDIRYQLVDNDSAYMNHGVESHWT